MTVLRYAESLNLLPSLSLFNPSVSSWLPPPSYSSSFFALLVLVVRIKATVLWRNKYRSPKMSMLSNFSIFIKVIHSGVNKEFSLN